MGIDYGMEGEAGWCSCSAGGRPWRLPPQSMARPCEEPPGGRKWWLHLKAGGATDGPCRLASYPGKVALEHLDQQQGFALLQEITSSRNLLAYGLRVMRTGAFVDTTRDPILTMLSIGLEKLYKLTLGLIALDHDHRWPTKAQMQDQGHRLNKMHQAVMDELQARTSDRSEYVRGLLAEIEDDPVVSPFVRALDMYGRQGRFYYLDHLGDSLQPLSPDEVWQDIENAASTDPGVAALYQQAMRDVRNNEAWEQATRALRDRIAAALERVWIAIAVCGRNHVLGETGTTFGFEVHPDAVGRQ